MKRVWSGSSLPDTAHLANVLEQADITCIVKNRDLGGGIGDLPVFDSSPEIWVLDDRDVERATAVIHDSLRPAASAASWRCSRCGADNEAQFAACWSCGRGDGRPEEPT